MGIFQNQQKLKIFLIIYIFCSSIHSKCRCNGEEKNKKIANFVFGDSIVDVGNNNYIISLSKANYVPNGIDFGMPTGRFTNGRTIVDIIGQELGLGAFPPPYLAPTTKGSVILQGVNYASGAGGILNETGVLFGGRLNMDAQLDNFANTRQDMIDMIGEEEAMEVLNKALYSVTMGSNDFINNYLTPGFSKLEQHLVTPQAFINSMIDKFRLQLTRLYNMGARKIVVVNIGPIGCIPYQRDINPTAGNDCVAFPNQLAEAFNTELKTLVNQLSTDLPDSIFVYADSFRLFTHLLDNYQSYGFENGDSACCYGSGRFGGLIPCGPTSKLCYDRSKYVFWDPYHPSDAANLLIAKRLIDGDTNVISPINFRQLLDYS